MGWPDHSEASAIEQRPRPCCSAPSNASAPAETLSDASLKLKNPSAGASPASFTTTPGSRWRQYSWDFARQKSSDDPADTRRILADLRETISGSIRDLRALAVELRPTALDDFGLRAALERLANTFGRRSGLQIDLQTSGLDVRLPGEVETALYRIVQESLTNIAKHAGAETVSIVAQNHTDRAVVVIEDDGRGFEVGGAASGLGLVSMRERTELLGGTLRVESSRDHGTTIAAEVPL